MKVIIVVGRTGCGKTTLALTLAQKPALLIPYDKIIPRIDKIGRYKAIIVDDAGLRDVEDWRQISEIVHYGRRWISEIWIVAHYFTQIPPDIRTAATQIWLGRLDKNLMPQNYKNLETPNDDLTFYGYGDDPRKIRLHLTK